MKNEQTYVFDWDLSFFRAKPRVFNLTEEQVQLQEDRAPLLDAVAEELRVQDEGGPINYTPDEMASGHFVIVKSSSKDPLQRPFWLCQVIQNNTGADSLRLAVNGQTTLIGHLCIKLLQAFCVQFQIDVRFFQTPCASLDTSHEAAQGKKEFKK